MKRADITKGDSIALKKAALLEALEKSLGVVTQACKSVGISRNQFYEYIKTDEDFAHAVKDTDEIVLDFAEAQLYKQVNEGNTTATIFLLKTKGRKRGYSESLDIRQEITQKLGEMSDEDIENQIQRLERIRNATKE